LALEECTLFCFKVDVAVLFGTSAHLYLPTRSGISEDNKRHTHYGVKLRCHKRDTYQQAVNT